MSGRDLMERLERESEKQLLELLWSGCLVIELELLYSNWLVTVVSHFCFACDQG